MHGINKNHNKETESRHWHKSEQNKTVCLGKRESSVLWFSVISISVKRERKKESLWLHAKENKKCNSQLRVLETLF